MHNKLKQKYLLFSLAPIILVFLGAMVIAVFLYNRTVSVMNEEAEKSSLRTVMNTAENMETLLNQARLSSTGIAIQMTSARTDLSFYRASINKLIVVQLNAASMMNPLVQYGYVFTFSDDCVLTQMGTSNEAANIFKSDMRLGGVDYKYFKEYFTSTHFLGECLPGFLPAAADFSSKRWIFAQSIPVDASSKPTGVIVFTLDDTWIRKSLSATLSDASSACALMNGESIAYWEQADKSAWSERDRAYLESSIAGLALGANRVTFPDGRDMLVCTAKMGEFLILHCVAVGAAFEEVRSFTIVTAVQTVAFFVLMTFTLTMYAHRRSRDVQVLLESVSPNSADTGSIEDKEHNLFHYLRNVVLTMQQDNATLSLRADEQLELLRALFLKRLFTGDFQMESDVIAEENIVGLTLSAAVYRVLIVKLLADDEAGGAYDVLNKALTDEFGANAKAVHMKNDRIACIIMSAETDIDDSLDAVMETVTQTSSVQGFLSSDVNDVMDVPRAYREAKTMADRMSVKDTRLHRYKDWYRDAALYNSDSSQFAEKKLLGLIAAGHAAKVGEELDRLKRESAEGANDVHNVVFCAYDLYRLAGHAASACGGENAGEALLEIRALLDDVVRDEAAFDSFFTRVRVFCLSLCQKPEGTRAESSRKVIIEINAYIDEHFADPELYVSSIATAFGITDKYLSQFYKEQTGEKISNVIENMRIERACELLADERLSINDIAVRSGYASTHTFRAAFKKVYGVTPTEYRESVRES